MSGLNDATTRLLAQERERLHALHARVGKGLEPEAIYGYVCRTVDPLLGALPAEPSPRVLLALFELGLVAMRRGLVGGLEPTAFERVAVRCLPRFGRHFTEAPHESFRRFGNGYARLARELGEAAAITWAESLAQLGGEAGSLDELSAWGLVLAWKAGLAEARPAAIDTARGLRPSLREALLGSRELDANPLARFCRPGHTAPLGPLREIGSVGGFLGFGGPFRRPPSLRATEAGVVASSAGQSFLLHADVFGLRLVPTTLEHFDTVDRDQPTLGARGKLEWRGQSITDARYARALSLVAHDGLVALSLTDSHRILVFGHGEAP
jgi:hypothetical protein